MALEFIRNLIRPHAPAAAELPPLCRELHECAGRFEVWLRKGMAEKGGDALSRLDVALEELRAATHARGEAKAEIPPEVASDGAAWLGEQIRSRHGGAWTEHPLFGLVLSSPGGVEHAHVLPLHLIDKKWQLGEGFALGRWIDTFEERLAAEKERLGKDLLPEECRASLADRLAATPAGGEQALATERLAAFAERCRRRLGNSLPLSLQGVRELERYLRSQFFLFAVDEAFLVDAGFFLGEVGRGLYQGKWDLAEVRATHDPTRVALVWPELPYYPVGRVYRLMTEQPEGVTLDEYLRLVPSARNELRKQQQTAQQGPENR